VQRVSACMRSRHLEILNDLSEKRHEKEDRQRREEERLRWRMQGLRERLLRRAICSSTVGGGSALADGGRARASSFGMPQAYAGIEKVCSLSFQDGGSAPSTAPRVSSLPPRTPAGATALQASLPAGYCAAPSEFRIESAEEASEDRRQRHLLQQAAMRNSSHEAIQRLLSLQGLQQQRILSAQQATERRKLRLRRARNQFFKQSQGACARDSAPPREGLPQPPQRSMRPQLTHDLSSDTSPPAVTIAVAIAALHTPTGSAAAAAPSPRSSPIAQNTPREAAVTLTQSIGGAVIGGITSVRNTSPSAKTNTITPRPPGGGRDGSRSRVGYGTYPGRHQTFDFISGTTSPRRILDLAAWKRAQHAPQDKKVFICLRGYPDFRDALLRRGWVQNTDKDSKCFDIKWAAVGDIQHGSLQAHQAANHFEHCTDLTTKVGLSLSLRSCVWQTGVNADGFYPRAFDLHDVLERADFVLDFKLTKTESVLRAFLEHIDGGAEKTFSEDVVSTAIKVCTRLLTDVDDVIDSPGLPEGLSDVLREEWGLLQQVCLDDPTQRLESRLKDSNLDAAIARRSTVRQLEDVARRQRSLQEATRRLEADREQDRVKPRSGKQKVVQCRDESASAALDAPVSSYASTRGQHLATQARWVLSELAKIHPQHREVNGSRNAWIIKPAGKSRGRGIQMMRELEEIFRATDLDEGQWVAQKYIERPQLIHGYKFDIRQWVLVVDWNPLTVYIWQQPYLRFAGEKYDATLTDRSEYMHLVNNCIQKKKEGFDQVNDDLQTSGFMWFKQQYQEWLHETYCTCNNHDTPFLQRPPYTCETFGVRWEDVAFTGKEDSDGEDGDDDIGRATASTPSLPLTSSTDAEGSGSVEAHEDAVKAKVSEEERTNTMQEAPQVADSAPCCEDLWETCIRPQMNDIVLQSLSCVVDQVQHRKLTVELFGYDFMISPGEGRPRVWLIEVNSSPACDYSTRVTTPLVKKMLEDTAKVMVDLREDPNASTGEWHIVRHSNEKRIVGKPIALAKLEVLGKEIQFSQNKPTRKSTKTIPAASVATAASPFPSADVTE